MRAPPQNRLTANQVQAFLAAEAIWRAYWPFVTASIIAVFMLIFGLAVAALEAAGLDKASSIDTTSIDVSVSSSSSKCGNSYNIGVGIWSGAVVVVAAISIFIISEF